MEARDRLPKKRSRISWFVSVLSYPCPVIQTGHMQEASSTTRRVREDACLRRGIMIHLAAVELLCSLIGYTISHRLQPTAAVICSKTRTSDICAASALDKFPGRGKPRRTTS